MVLAFYRRMIAWRKLHPALAKGGFRVVETSDAHIAYVRDTAEETLFCVFNLGDEPVSVSLPEGGWEQVPLPEFTAEITAKTAEVPPSQAAFARLLQIQNA